MQRDATCTATRRDGAPCTSPLVGASGRCFAHDPARHEQVAAARARGGHGKRRIARVEKLVPASLRPALALLFTALDETHAGELDPRAASAMAALAGAIGKLYQAGVLEERVAALEAVQPQPPGRWRA